jgi:acyl carrier protein
MDTLLAELKTKLVTILNLTDVQPDDINENDQLVGGELGLDSIDVLEMVVMIEKDYGVTINNKEIGTQVFASLKSLAEYIRANSPQCPP